MLTSAISPRCLPGGGGQRSTHVRHAKPVTFPKPKDESTADIPWIQELLSDLPPRGGRAAVPVPNYPPLAAYLHLRRSRRRPGQLQLKHVNHLPQALKWNSAVEPLHLAPPPGLKRKRTNGGTRRRGAGWTAALSRPRVKASF